MKLGLVVPRYGEDVAGGAEQHVRQIAERLGARHEVEVLTTCAVDPLHWENRYPAGTSTVGTLSVRRFAVARRRRPEEFDELDARVRVSEHTDGEEKAWLDEHGPVAPELVQHLRARHGDYGALIFFSGSAWTTYHGLHAAPQKSILVPTADDMYAARLRIFQVLLRQPKAFAFSSPEERTLLSRLAGVGELPGEVIGLGIDDAPVVPPDEIRQRLDLLGEYIVYAGRVEAENGCFRFFEDFTRFAREMAPTLNLVLLGKAVLPVPVHVNITHLGLLSDTERLSAIGASRLLVHPSRSGTLATPLLEAWKMARPVLVHGSSEVLVGQVQRARGGLSYTSYEELSETLSWLLERPQEADALGRRGRAYFQASHAWPVILDKYERLLATVRAH